MTRPSRPGRSPPPSPRRKTPALGAGLILGLAAGAAGCADDPPFIAPVPPAADAGCVVGEVARTFDVYFVVDVSGSMNTFLLGPDGSGSGGLADRLGTFALGFPTRDQNDDRVVVNYYVVAFVNDVKLFPVGAERMTSHIAVAAALREAIQAATPERNLNNSTPNADSDENLLDALGAVIDRAPSADTTLVLAATDAEFRERGETLSGGITVQRTYDEVVEGIRELGIRVHAFVPGPVDGLSRPYRGQVALPDINEGLVFSLDELTGDPEALDAILRQLASDASCNPVVGSERPDAST